MCFDMWRHNSPGMGAHLQTGVLLVSQFWPAKAPSRPHLLTGGYVLKTDRLHPWAEGGRLGGRKRQRRSPLSLSDIAKLVFYIYIYICYIFAFKYKNGQTVLFSAYLIPQQLTFISSWHYINLIASADNMLALSVEAHFLVKLCNY